MPHHCAMAAPLRQNHPKPNSACRSASSFYYICAVCSLANARMTEAAYLALESLGSAKTRDVGSRDSWAIIGVKGAAIGSVPELLVTRFNSFAEVEQAAPAVHLVDGFHFYYTTS